jgi:hypothetical protein
VTTPAALTAPTGWSLARAGAFVWRSWRGLTARHFYYAALAGLALGTIDGIGWVLWAPDLRDPWWETFFLAGFGPFMVHALLLLLCLAVAAHVTTNRTPKWMPFVVAGTIATILMATLDLGVSYAVSKARGEPWPAAAELLVVYLYGVVPKPLPIALLVALGYMYGLDAWKRGNTLRDAQLERARLSRRAYESRLQALQARVEPQFLFETLGRIELLYEADARLGQRMLDDLIVFLRAALPALYDPSSTVATELALARAWLDIMCIRLSGSLSFSIAGPDPGQDARMPPMVLLPLVQQAFAAATDASPDRPAIEITVTVADARLLVLVTACRAAFAAESAATTTVRGRLNALYGADAMLALRPLDLHASQAQLEIPHEFAERHHR